MTSAFRVFPFACVFAATGLTAADSPEGIAFFEKKVQPILVEHCYECHSVDTKKLRGELYLDSKPGWQTGGDSGPAIFPGGADGSLMIRAVHYREENIELPSKQQLPRTAIDTLVQWVAMGAPNPRTEATAPAPQKIDIEEGRKFRSFQPVEKQHGLLDETLVIWGGEFGRTPYSENKNGRDHNPHAATVWMAGGGLKPGFSYGKTDEPGFKGGENKVHIHDLHATIWHLLGLDHEQLTFEYSGRPFRLTDVYGRVEKEIFA